MASRRRTPEQGQLNFSDCEVPAEAAGRLSQPAGSPNPDEREDGRSQVESWSTPAASGEASAGHRIHEVLNLQPPPQGRDEWIERIGQRMSSPELHPLETAQKALEENPADPYVLELAAFAALVEDRPDICLRYLHRLSKRYYPSPIVYLGRAIALAQKGAWAAAQALLGKYPIPRTFYGWVVPPEVPPAWVHRWSTAIVKWKPESRPKRNEAGRSAPQRRQPGRRAENSKRGGGPQEKRQKNLAASLRGVPPPIPDSPEIPSLPLMAAEIPITFLLPDPDSYRLVEEDAGDSPGDYLLRLDINYLALLQEFDELLCLSRLRGVDHYSYQVETARKVLRHFRGRVLLADEVGLGKTIEAGIILKEYLMRGMVERVLVLTPPSLVGQWREEMESKFEIAFATTQDRLFRKDPEAFWSQPRIIASIAVARREPHGRLLVRHPKDLVIVDEAHHLKNRRSKNWKLVDAVQKRFLLLLSATPVENNLIELYNMLTLLKPGIFKTEREFRSAFVSAENPRVPSNREKLHALMRDVMIRNTRSLVQVPLPPRHAATLIVDASEDEQSCYGELTRWIRSRSAQAAHPSGLHWLLQAAGSSAAAASAAMARLAAKFPAAQLSELQTRYARLPAAGGKIRALLDLLQRNPPEKKIIFVRFRETLRLLDSLLREQGVSLVRFDGDMPGAEKDEAIDLFRDRYDVLLTTESGGEGRNLQFCNTLINFDLPWNPQAIEQRIGRIHRIGQAREVFVFNLAGRNTVEEEVLRILEEKIHMFQLVVGEVQSILGAMEEERDFSSQVFAAWIENSEESRQAAFDALGERLSQARYQYEAAKTLDDEIFGKDFGAI